MNGFTLNNQSVNDNQAKIKSYVDQLHQVIERCRRELVIDFYNYWSDLVKNNQSKNFNDCNLTNSETNIAVKNSSSDNVLANKK